MAWTQAFLGDWSTTRIPANYGITGIPTILLIGPDGKIIDAQLRGDRIKAAVATALRTPAKN
jgi:hypothetical protein